MSGRRVGWEHQGIGKGVASHVEVEKAREEAERPKKSPRPEPKRTPEGDQAALAKLDAAADLVREAGGKVAPPIPCCPVCKKPSGCACEEGDREFVLRTRFEASVDKVARCPRCGAPLSVFYVPRPGSAIEPGTGKLRLSQFSALHGCSVCATDAIVGFLQVQGCAVELADRHGAPL